MTVAQVLIGQKTGKTLGFLGILLGSIQLLSKLIIFYLTRSLSHLRQLLKHITEVYEVVVVGMEHATGLRRFGKQNDGSCYLVDGAELQGFVVDSIRITTQHLEDTDAPHRTIRIEVHLELTVSGTWSQITHTHHLSIQLVQGNSFKHDALRDELGVNILIAQILSEIEILLGVYQVLRRNTVNRHACCAVGGHVNQPCFVQQAELDAVDGSTHVDILNIRTL